MMSRKLRRTPIERFIDNDGRDDRRALWESRQRKAGIVRCNLRVHVADLAGIKRYAANLLKARQEAASAAAHEQPESATAITPGHVPVAADADTMERLPLRSPALV